MGVTAGGDDHHDLIQWDGGGSGGRGGSGSAEEKILVSVRVRPLNAKEIAGNDFADWECINDTTIFYKNCLGERSMYPNAYYFDRVFGSDCTTRQVYEEAAKQVALSVVNGINATVFAYGQTSSGKTYTMTGITQYTIADLYDYIDRHNEREFLVKFSAMEIYNEAVRDLLSLDSTPLRLLDDPERGTVVEKLIEEPLRDKGHLLELLAVCEAQRQVGETALNETSSRSHQIIRLVVQSSARQCLGARNTSTLSASVNFVDLAGSERSSQTLSGGARLKEGCHINRSLLTLGKVIRNLSKGRHGHVPYRDSKLTRILQNSLGGNSRTAIICTMSPAHSHLEQSRNTLLFATCAKEVTTNSQVNILMSDKALVKQLRKELARLEGELKNLSSVTVSSDLTAVLREKEIRIEKMDEEIKELSRQRDIAQSQVEELLRSSGQHEVSSAQDASHQHLRQQQRISSLNDSSTTYYASEYQRLDADLKTFESYGHNDLELSCSHPEILEDFESRFLSDDASPYIFRKPMEPLPPDESQKWEDNVETTERDDEDNCKEVRCIEVTESRMNRRSLDGNFTEEVGHESLEKEAPEEEEEKQTLTEPKDSYNVMPQEEMKMEHCQSPIDSEALVRRIRELQNTIDHLVDHYPGYDYSPYSNESSLSSCRGFRLSRSRSCKAILTTTTPSHKFERLGQNLHMISPGFEEISEGSRGLYAADDLNNGDIFKGYKKERRPTNAAALSSEMEEEISEGSRGLHKADDLNDIDIVKGYKKEIQPTNASAPTNEMEEDKKILDSSDLSSSRSLVTALSDVSKTNLGKPEDEEGFTMIEAKETEALSNSSSDNEDDKASDKKNEKQDKPAKRPTDDALEEMEVGNQSPPSWPQEFERQQRMIIELWHACHTSLVHRTFFFLLFKGDPSDSIYLEVELRRLSFMKSKFSQGAPISMEGQILTAASCKRNLYREREMLTKQMQKKFSEKEREALFQKWGIALDSKKRRLQLANRLWMDPHDMHHLRESAALIAKLVGFTEEDGVPKEMFVGPSFTPRAVSRRSYSWKI